MNVFEGVVLACVDAEMFDFGEKMSWLVCLRRKQSQKQVGCTYIKSSDMYDKVQPFTLRVGLPKFSSVQFGGHFC